MCAEVDGIAAGPYLWPPSFAYSKILTRGRYLSRHSRCLRAARYCKRFSRQAPWFSRSIATNSLRDGCPHAVVPTETTSSQPPEGAAVPRKTKADAAKRCCASSFVSPLDSVVGSPVVRGGQRPNRFASRLMLVGGAGQGSWGLGGVVEGVLGTARFRLCAPWLLFLCIAARAQRPRAVAL